MKNHPILLPLGQFDTFLLWKFSWIRESCRWWCYVFCFSVKNAYKWFVSKLEVPLDLIIEECGVIFAVLPNHHHHHQQTDRPPVWPFKRECILVIWLNSPEGSKMRRISRNARTMQRIYISEGLSASTPKSWSFLKSKHAQRDSCLFPSTHNTSSVTHKISNEKWDGMFVPSCSWREHPIRWQISFIIFYLRYLTFKHFLKLIWRNKNATQRRIYAHQTTDKPEILDECHCHIKTS